MVDSSGNVFVADTGNGYIWKFALTWNYESGCTDGSKCCDWDYDCYYYNDRWSYSQYYGGDPPEWTYCPCDKTYPVVDLSQATPLVSIDVCLPVSPSLYPLVSPHNQIVNALSNKSTYLTVPMRANSTFTSVLLFIFPSAGWYGSTGVQRR